MSGNDHPKWFIVPGENRPVMSRPPKLTATRAFVQLVEDARRDNPTPEAFADWVANFAEEYGASTAEPMFDMEGHGPLCSWCATIWPLCGHQHMSEVEGIGGES